MYMAAIFSQKYLDYFQLPVVHTQPIHFQTPILHTLSSVNKLRLQCKKSDKGLIQKYNIQIQQHNVRITQEDTAKHQLIDDFNGLKAFIN